ncbi:hypothetical protein UFOVP337_39 [uncultured Caudovirales phage]|uniref:Uncharacterized protein n=1 Tax=uncultured Caudovirales phage TaxID=2100421 RepID=A0A6J5LZE6_9CAUD|nr:hypothetical protein UFOVP337_39 [uncultured Caudovirales phage]
MSKEAMKLALEALELAKRSHGMMLLSDPPQEAWKTYRVDGSMNRAITALREALAEQPAQQEEDLYELAVRADNEGQP